MSHSACLCYLRRVDDTSTEAARAQAEALRRLGPAKRFLVACDMSEMVRDLARSRIAKQHPGFDDRAIQAQLIWELYGVRRER